MPAERARIGVVGTGWWATQHHLPGLVSYEGAEVTAIADPDPDKLQAAGEAFGVEKRFADHRELLTSGLVDGVIVAVPHVHHYPIAKDALDAGVHVLVEKPMTLRAADAWDLVARAERNGLHLMCGYTFQFTRHAALAREIVRSRRLGELRLVAGQFASMVESYLRGRPDEYAGVFEFPITGPRPDTYSDPAIAGGGQGMTQVTHPMGMVFWVTGLRAAEVYAQMAGFGLAVDLVDAVTYRLRDGTLGTIASTGTIAPGQDQHQELFYYGTRGKLAQDLVHGRLLAEFDDGSEERPEDLAEEEVYPTFAPGRCLADLITGTGTNPAPGAEAAAAVEFLEAAYRSADSGLPVKVEGA